MTYGPDHAFAVPALVDDRPIVGDETNRLRLAFPASTGIRVELASADHARTWQPRAWELDQGFEASGMREQAVLDAENSRLWRVSRAGADVALIGIMQTIPGVGNLYLLGAAALETDLEFRDLRRMKRLAREILPAAMRENDFHRVHVFVDARDPVHLHFAEHHGFVEEGLCKGLSPTGYDTFLMRYERA